MALHTCANRCPPLLPTGSPFAGVSSSVSEPALPSSLRQSPRRSEVIRVGPCMQVGPNHTPQPTGIQLPCPQRFGTGAPTPPYASVGPLHWGMTNPGGSQPPYPVGSHHQDGVVPNPTQPAAAAGPHQSESPPFVGVGLPALADFPSSPQQSLRRVEDGRSVTPRPKRRRR